MLGDRAYLALANLVLVLHVLIVLFVVGGLVLIACGNWRGWRWVNTWWFRLAHLAAIGIVVAEAWFGIVCPLTTFEAWLRVRAGAPVQGGSGFIEYWLQRLLYYDAPAWVFTLAYTLFALLVVLAWWRYPPRRGGGH
jgi:uncharacterized protein DUF2784